MRRVERFALDVSRRRHVGHLAKTSEEEHGVGVRRNLPDHFDTQPVRAQSARECVGDSRVIGDDLRLLRVGQPTHREATRRCIDQVHREAPNRRVLLLALDLRRGRPRCVR